MYIVWTDYGYEGWSPAYYQNLEDAIKHNSYGSDKIITKEVRIEVKEIEGAR